MLTRALSRAVMGVGGLCAMVYGLCNIKQAKGADDLLYIGLIFLGFYCVIACLMGQKKGGGDGNS